MLIKKAALELKKKGIKAPEWASFVKTGVHKERPPVDDDWWYHRMAAVLRSVAVLGPIGVAKLRTKYGGKQRRGHKPSRFAKGSGSILRKVLQQFEEINYVKQATVGNHKGRIIAKEGKLFLNSIADGIASEMAKVPKKTEPTPKVEEVKAKEEKSSEVKKEPKANTKPSVKETPKKEEVNTKTGVKKETSKADIKPDVKETPIKEEVNTKTGEKETSDVKEEPKAKEEKSSEVKEQ